MIKSQIRDEDWETYREDSMDPILMGFILSGLINSNITVNPRMKQHELDLSHNNCMSFVIFFKA